MEVNSIKRHSLHKMYDNRNLIQKKKAFHLRVSLISKFECTKFEAGVQNFSKIRDSLTF